MRILASGDIHGDSSLAKRLAETAVKENVDLVILTGDLTYAEQSSENILGHFAKRGKKVFLIPGNHDSPATADFLAEAYDMRNMHGYGIKYGDIGFFGAGGANIGPIFNVSDKDTYELLKKGHERIKGAKLKVLITHNHPTGSMMENFSNIVPGNAGLRKAIDAFHPDIVLCSHVHEAAGIEEQIGKTKVINVSRQFKIIDL